MAHRLNTKLAEIAAASLTYQGDTDLVAKCFEDKTTDLFKESIRRSLDFFDLKNGKGSPKGVSGPVVDAQTKADIDSLVDFIRSQTGPRLVKDLKFPKDFKFDVEVQFEDPSSAMMEVALALRNTQIYAVKINNSLITSELAIQAATDWEADVAVIISNSALESMVGIGVTIKPTCLRLRSGLDVSAWERLSRVSAMNPQEGCELGRQYQIHFFEDVRSYAVGLGDTASVFDYAAHQLPTQPGYALAAHTSWDLRK